MTSATYYSMKEGILDVISFSVLPNFKSTFKKILDTKSLKLNKDFLPRKRACFHQVVFFCPF